VIIWLASYPRSGNTFFRILLNHLYGIKTYSIYNDPLFDELKGSSEIIGHQRLELPFEDLVASEKVFFIKTHNLPNDNHPAIYLIRDGRDSLVSFAYYLMSFGDGSSKKSLLSRVKRLTGWNESAEILRNLIIASGGDYGSWSENVNQWKSREGLTCIIKYEDLIVDPAGQTARTLSEIGLSEQLLLAGKVPSFEELHERWPKFFRKGKSGGWRSAMDPELEVLFWKYHGETMQELGYEG